MTLDELDIATLPTRDQDDSLRMQLLRFAKILRQHKDNHGAALVLRAVGEIGERPPMTDHSEAPFKAPFSVADRHTTRQSYDIRDDNGKFVADGHDKETLQWLCDTLNTRAALPREDGWRPIESAPRDGTLIVIWNAIYTHCPLAKWAERDGDDGWFHGWELSGLHSPCCSCEDDFIGWNEDIEDGYMPTHWLPAPADKPTPDGGENG